MVIKTKARSWGNSVGIVIPKKEAEKIGIKPGEELTVDIKKQRIETFGILRDLRKRKKKSTSEILREIDRDFWGDE